MAILQSANVVFYHPLDNLTEFLQTQAWIGVGQSFGLGKVSNALTGGLAKATTASAYSASIGATRLAFSVWTRAVGPSTTTAPPVTTAPGAITGPPPQLLEDRAIMMAMGIPASRLGGFT